MPSAELLCRCLGRMYKLKLMGSNKPTSPHSMMHDRTGSRLQTILRSMEARDSRGRMSPSILGGQERMIRLYARIMLPLSLPNLLAAKCRGLLGPSPLVLCSKGLQMGSILGT